MPADQRRRLDEDRRVAPIEPVGEPGEDQPSRLRGTTRLDLTFLVEGQLFAQKEVLCREGKARAKHRCRKRHASMRSISSVRARGMRLRSKPRHRAIQGIPLIHKL
jgi:hypothetical protein